MIAPYNVLKRLLSLDHVTPNHPTRDPKTGDKFGTGGGGPVVERCVLWRHESGAKEGVREAPKFLQAVVNGRYRFFSPACGKIISVQHRAIGMPLEDNPIGVQVDCR